MTAPLLIFPATYSLIAVQRVRWLHLNRPAAVGRRGGARPRRAAAVSLGGP